MVSLSTIQSALSRDEPHRLAELQRQHAQRLQSLTASLSMAATLAEVADAVIEGSCAAFPESAATIIARLTPGGDEIEVFAASELPGQVFENWRAFPLSSNTPIAEVVRSGEVLCLESPDDWTSRYPELVHLLAETGHRAQVIAPLIAGGRVIGAVGIAFISDQAFSATDREFASALARQCAVAIERARLFETEQIARKAAETASRAKSDFLAAMSHELRTPLNAIGGYTQLLEMGIHGPVTSEQRVALERIRTSQAHLVGLIDSVLEFSRAEAGAVRYAIVPVSVSQTLEFCEQLTAPQMRRAELSYSVELSEADMTVQADPQQLRQILLNLLSNAIKHTTEGGSIKLRVSSDEEVVRMSIADSGQGIDEDNLDAIFEPFVQIAMANGATRGVGLGLPISRNLARGMGGDLVVSSRVGEGSTFTLTLKKNA